MLHMIDGKGHHGLLPNFKVKESSFSPLSMLLAVGFFVEVLHEVEKAPILS